MHFLCLAYLLLSLNSHDIQVAFFKIYQNSDTLSIKFVFEKEDILTVIENKNTFSIKLNNQIVNINYDKFTVKDKHISLVGQFSDSIKEVHSLELDNTCLLNIKNHSNIIQVTLNNQERDFLMNRKRTNIQINY